jgi:hypothetical protein
MKDGLLVWVAIVVLGVSILVVGLGSLRHDSGLHDVDGSEMLCSAWSDSTSLMCESDKTTLGLTSLSTTAEVQHFVDSCPNHDVKVLKGVGCIGKQFIIEENNGSYIVR